MLFSLVIGNIVALVVSGLALLVRKPVSNSRTGKVTWGAVIVAGYSFCPLAPGMAIGAKPLKKMGVAIPSIVIDFAPLWIALDKGLFREGYDAVVPLGTRPSLVAFSRAIIRRYGMEDRVVDFGVSGFDLPDLAAHHGQSSNQRPFEWWCSWLMVRAR